MRKILTLTVALAVTTFAAGYAIDAQNADSKPAGRMERAAGALKAATAEAKEAAPARKKMADVTPEEMMAAMQKCMTPGEGHKVLEPLAGNFAGKTTMWMKPGAEPMTSDCTCAREWILGGRHLKEAFKGSFMGHEFEGVGTVGYNNAAKRYESGWICNMCTSNAYSTGTYDAAAKAISFESTMMCCVCNEWLKTRMVLKMTNNDEHVLEFYMPYDGVEYKHMEITLKRVK